MNPIKQWIYLPYLKSIGALMLYLMHKIKCMRLFNIIFISLISPLQAADTKPLIIGVDMFSPPFVMQGGKKELYGFDISMMMSLCKLMQRHCQFKQFKWVDLLGAVSTNKIDLAVSSITITAERARKMNFSLPYSLSYSRFITRSDRFIKEPFNMESLNNKKIGAYQGTVYENNVSKFGIKNPVIKTYAGYEEALRALKNNEVDFILLDSPTALYWAANSSGAFKTAGKPIIYGYGIGIAISPDNAALIPELNKALLNYQDSKEYRSNYHRYLEEF